MRKEECAQTKCENTYTTQIIIIKCFNIVMYVYVQKKKQKQTNVPPAASPRGRELKECGT